ncbi:phage/plasmid replication protein, II/X family [Alteromonas flava]|uniref:phage/plasmid replication protein, II/X family n=1 Tax=Alteromonas flava TaxID=2048003 RepID=UPI000C288CD8|nr:phage/plasmid replication protein, II/X family [Alteromonas flava]
MIDWVRATLPLTHLPLNSGQVVSINADGQIEWQTPKRVMATGSFDKRISIKSVGSDGYGCATHLVVSGNPSKFLQGHNVFGSDDLVSLMHDTYELICKQFSIIPSSLERKMVEQGAYKVTTIDINYSFQLPTRDDVKSFIRAMEFKAKTRHGRPTTKGGTLYFGKTSERWAIKLYCKAEEIQSKTGRIPESLTNKGIEDWAENKLRVELRLLSKELEKLDLVCAGDITPKVIKQTFNEYLGKIQMTDQVKLSSKAKSELPTRLVSTYTLWSEGHNVRQMMSKATYYRQRKALMEYGINIDLSPCEKLTTNVVPMFRILEAAPVDVPEWAYQKQLIHPSARYA